MPLRPGEPKLSFALTGVAALLVLSGLLPGISSTAEGAVPDVASACGPIVQDDRIGRYCETDDGLLKTFSTRTGRFLGYVHAEDHPRELFVDPFGAPDEDGEDEEGPDTLGAPALEDGRYVEHARQPHCVDPATTPDAAYHTRVLYVRYLNEEDTYPQKVEVIRQLVREANGLLYDTGKQLGRTMLYKVHCSQGEITVDSVVLPSTCKEQDCFNDMVDQTRDLGYNDPRVKYWIWTENGSCACAGKAHRFDDDSPGASNNNNGNMGMPMFAATFRGAASVRLMMHEHGHTMGAVQQHTDTDSGHNNLGHCWDGRDIMCLPQGGEEHPYVDDACPAYEWDCGHDTYFHPDPPPGSYLSDHWNLASPANRFLIAGNSYPDAAFDSFAMEEDSPTTPIPVLANDADPDGDDMFLESVSQPWSVQIDGNGDVTYIAPSGATAVVDGDRVDYLPPPDYFGTDLFSYVVRDRADPADDTVLNATGFILVTVTPVNDPPVAEEDRFVLQEDSEKSLPLQAFDADGDTLEWSVIAGPTAGDLRGELPGIIYKPDADAYGECGDAPTVQDCDSFLVQVDDGQVTSQARVWLDVVPVNDAPVVQDDDLFVTMDTENFLDVMADDTPGPGPEVEDQVLSLAALGPDADNLYAVPATAPTAQGGQVSLDTAGGFEQVKYTPQPGYMGDDGFAYRVCDDEPEPLCSVGNVTVHVVDGDVAAYPDTYTVAEDGELDVGTMEGVLFSGTPGPDVFPNNDDPGKGLENVTVRMVTGVTNGGLSLFPDGAFVYRPDADFYGVDTFRYNITYRDAADEFYSNEVTVTIAVTSVNDAPLAQGQTLTMTEDSSIDITLVASDTEDTVQADPPIPLTFTLGDLPRNGDLHGTPPDLVYIPRPEFAGEDSFTFDVTDSEGLKTTGVVGLQVQGRNDAPVASDDAYLMRPDRTNRVFSAEGVLHNDDDADGDAMHAQYVHAPEHGVLDLRADGGFLYTPDPGYTGPDLFTYRATDANGAASYTATVLLDVLANEPPVADIHTPFTTVPMGQAIRFLDRSSDPDGSIEEWTWDFADGGTSTQRDPAHTFRNPGEYVVSLKVVDDDHATATASLRMLVTQPHVVPAAGSTLSADAGETMHVMAGRTVFLDGGSNATRTLSYEWTQPGGALVVLHDADKRNATFQAPALEPGEDVRILTFELRVFDGRQESPPATVQVHVFAPHLAPSDIVRADAGPDLVTLSGATVQIMPAHEGFLDRPSFTWTQVDGPPVSLQAAGGALQFVAPHASELTGLAFEVQAVGGGLSSQPDGVTVFVQPGTAPRGFDVAPLDASSFHFVTRLSTNTTEDLVYTWDFGDGTNGTGAQPRHAYREAGAYTVHLTASNGMGYEQSWTQRVQVDSVPDADGAGGTAGATADDGGGLPILVMALAGAATLLALAGVTWFRMRRRPLA